ncbi:clathrin interactor EPSIN 1-like [Papaver somniferum]|uniref:clathrin interactor EPSIN 1-like n=1 Tax=Papaver somniferum TaxID=3469 RepID=UPI000E6FFA8E|nr:clathrin interactor EPSIN 1-like [Papaver somniferum]
MEFIKFIDQTVREIKKEVNVKILKVPEIQQKVYDATSYEPWGSHGSDLTEIAQATKKLEHLALFPLLIGTSTDCKIIMNVLWTGLADGGSNWRNVYKALAVMEYLVAHGSDTAVYDIINHSFQISANVDLFAAKPFSSSASSSTMVDFFTTRRPVLQAKTKTGVVSIKSQIGDPFSEMLLNSVDESIRSQTFDPFSGKQLNSFDDS